MSGFLSILSARLRSAGRPQRIARSLAAAAIAIAGAPLLVMLVLFVFGSIAGGNLAQTAIAAVTWAASVGVIITLVAAFILLFGIISVAGVLLGDRLARSLLAALRAIPLLLLTTLVLIVAIVVLVVLWPLATIAGLVAALVLRLRRKPGARRALIAAIPFLPVVFSLLLIPASLAAALERPRSLGVLLRSAIATVRIRKRGLFVFILLSAAISAGLSWIGTSVSEALETAGDTGASLLAIAVALVLLIAAVGATLVVALPPRVSPERPALVRAPRTRLIARVAVVLTVSLVLSLNPVLTPPPASAAELITPVLTQGFDVGGHSVTLSADVNVPDGDPSGSVQFYDDTTALGAPIRVTRSGFDPTSGTANLPGHPSVDPGQHHFSFSFTPDSPLVDAGVSTPLSWHYTATTELSIAVDAAASVDGPVEVTVTAAANYATAVKPEGTVVIGWDGDSTEVALVDGVAVTTIANLPSPEITASYDGSADFSSASTSFQVGAAPEDTVIAVYISNPTPVVGDWLVAAASMSAPNAPYGTVIKGSVSVYAGATLLVGNADFNDSVVIPTSSLHSGTTSLRFEFVPDAGFVGSETLVDVDLEPATTSVQATLSDTSTVWGEALTYDLTVTSSADGFRMVEIRESTNVLITIQPIYITNGTATVSVDLSSALRPGGHTLKAVVPGDSDHTEATSTTTNSLVGAANTSTTLSFSTTSPQVGQPVTITATVASTAGLAEPIDGFIIFNLPDGSQQRADVADGVSSLEWTGNSAMTGNVIAMYSGSPFLFAGSTKLESLTVSLVASTAPTASWTGTLTPSDRTITLTYAAASGHDAPSGTVRILDAANGILATGSLLNGVVTLPVIGSLGAHPVLRAVYAGDSTYSTRTDVLPAAVLTNYSPTVTLAGPSSVALGTAFVVTVDVGNVPLGLVQQVTLTSTAPGGAVTSLGTVTLNGIGHASKSVTLLVDGTHQIGATVTFTTASELAVASATSVPVIVDPVPVPSLIVTSSTVSPAAGGALDLYVTAQRLGSGVIGVPSGTTAEVRDGANVLLGTVTLLIAGGVDGYRGQLHLTNVHGGILSVHAVIVYGPLSATVSSPVFTVQVTAPSTLLDLQSTSVAVGSLMPLVVTAYPVGGLSGPSRSLPAVVTVGAAEYPVTLTRSVATGPFTGTVSIPTAHAGDLTIGASIAGDGADTSAASGTYYAHVDKRPTSIVATIQQGADAGEAIIVRAQVIQTGATTSPAPTGPIYVTSTRTGAVCIIDVSQVCTIPGDQVPAGVNPFTVSYEGDAENLPSTGSTSHTTGARTSSIAVTFSPAIDAWVFGDPVTATWVTTTSGASPVGRVNVTIANQHCFGPAAAGSCTVTPYSTATSGRVSAAYLVAFAPSDGAPVAQVQGEANAYVCVYPVIRGNADYSGAVRCGASGTGVRAGSSITLSATPTPRYVIDHWVVNGVTVGTGSTLRVRVDGPATYSYVERYAPTCFTLNLAPVRADKVTNGGYVTTYTAPNCSNPTTPTSADLADVAAGHPRYVAGTLVTVNLIPNYGEPAVLLDAVTGVTPLSDAIAQVVMDKDRTISATFKIKACTAVSIFPTEGGTVALTSATRPAASSVMQPATGACTTVTGEPGYVPGTKLTFTATPATDSRIFSWSLVTTYPYLTTSDSAVVAVGTASGSTPPIALTQSLVVPAETPVQVAARFAQVKCVSVTIVSRTVVSPYFTVAEENAQKGATGSARDSESGCGGVKDSRTVKLSTSKWYRIITDTRSYIASGSLEVSTADPIYYTQWLIGSTFVLWDTPAAQGVKRLMSRGPGPGFRDVTEATSDAAFGDRAYREGPILDLATVPSGITVTANWVITSETECFAPQVSLPQGGNYTLERKYADEPFCEDPHAVAKGEQMTFRAVRADSAPALTPLLSGAGQVQTSPASFRGSETYMLEYCTPFVLDVRLHDDSGHITTASADQARALFEDDGGCPSGWTRPNRTLTTALSGSGAVNYTVIGSADGYGPQLAVDATGGVTGANRVDLQVICFTLSINDASISTPGNCPGGAANRFLRGSQVRVEADESDRFDGWTGIDASQGEYAWLIMDTNRSVYADLHFDSIWDQVSNALSSVAQRVVAATVSIATGMLLAGTFMVKASGWVLNGTAMVLRAAGVNGAAVDGIDRAGSVIVTQFDVLSLLGNCMSSVAAGGSGMILTVPPGSAPVPSGGNVDETIAAAKSQLSQQLASAGINSNLPLGKLMGNFGTVINVFGSGISAYSADAASSWSSYGSNLGNCAQTGMQTAIETEYGK